MTALADQGGDFVGAEAGARAEGHGKMARVYRSGPSGWQWKAHRRLHQTLPQLLGRGHDLWIVSELVDLVDLFVDVPDQGVRDPSTAK